MWWQVSENHWTTAVPDYSCDLDVDDTTAGCCAIASISGFHADSDISGKDKAKYIQGMRESIEEALNEHVDPCCSLVMCSVNTDQKEAEKLLIELGFVSPLASWAWRNPVHSRYSTGVKMYVKPLYKIAKTKPRIKAKG